jgi:hypothetical protein
MARELDYVGAFRAAAFDWAVRYLRARRRRAAAAVGAAAAGAPPKPSHSPPTAAAAPRCSWSAIEPRHNHPPKETTTMNRILKGL